MLKTSVQFEYDSLEILCTLCSVFTVSELQSSKRQDGERQKKETENHIAILKHEWQIHKWHYLNKNKHKNVKTLNKTFKDILLLSFYSIYAFYDGYSHCD